ncbi:hypothetical protein C2S53_013883 [Perilla frutescens var. hirtella]|uniref:TraB family protein n=1 Tax=Perilla frutescens var. hirtella TaxID=608512 RepID=A0AAD4JIK6_PERFH|nr:hypothetical protein C2S53_013883 [Perilla frutescens var. hirtella]
MYGLNRLKSANHLIALFAVSPAAATYQKRLFRFSSLFRSIPSKHSNSAAIDYFVYVGKGGKISGQSLIENQSRRNDRNKIYKRKVLPPELSRHTAMLTCESAANGGVCDVFLVGTNHVYAKSAQQVKAVIEFLKPQVVFLELCSNRRNGILPPQKKKILEFLYLAIMLQFPLVPIYSLAEPVLGENKQGIGAVEVLYGAEFHLAYEEAMKYGAKVILGDQPYEISWRRRWIKIPLWDKIKFMYTSLFEEELSRRDLTKMMKKIEEDGQTVPDQDIRDMKKLPAYMEIMVNERDQYMSTKLLRVAREHNSVVAVVGSAHLPGIQKNWKQPVDVEQLLSAPSDVVMLISYGVLTEWNTLIPKTVSSIN